MKFRLIVFLMALCILSSGCSTGGDYIGSGTAVSMGWVSKPHGRVVMYDTGARELQKYADTQVSWGGSRCNIGRIKNISIFSMEPVWGIGWFIPDLLLDIFTFPWTVSADKIKKKKR